MKFRTIFEIIVIGGLLFYIFGLEPAKEYYKSTKEYVTEYIHKFIYKNNIIEENNNTIFTDTLAVTQHKGNSNIIYTDSIPFKYENNQIKLKIYVDDIPVNGILDTGAMGSISLSYAEYEFFKRQGVEIGSLTKGEVYGISGKPVTVYRGQLHNVRIGSIKYDIIDVEYCEVVDNDYGEPQENLFGIDIFNKRFTVDYEANMIYFF